MPVDLANYKGREQAYVKHFLLDAYLEALIHKIASRYDHVVYVDGFSGPWQAAGRDYTDTSFGIALRSLRSAKEAWKRQGRNVRMTAHLVEKSSLAFKELEKLPPKFPDIEIVPHHGDFVALAPDLAARIPRNAFAFLFIDPKGWGIDIRALEPLLRLANCEVLFNFMFEFINRAASMREAVTVEGLDKLMPLGNWRDKLVAATSPDARKRILVDTFAATIGKIGGYRFVADTPVLRPIKDREIYSLVYATRKPPGIEVFRKCQAKTLDEQALIRSTAKAEARSAATGQTEAFSFSEIAPDTTKAFLAREAAAARQMFLEMVPVAPATIVFGDVWPKVLTSHAIRKTDLGRMAAAMRKSGELTFIDWGLRKQVPDDGYRMSRPN